MSDCVKVRVVSASKIDKSVDFEIVGMKSNKKTQKTVIINTRKDDKRKKVILSVDENMIFHVLINEKEIVFIK